jgi:hypothetical protein
MTPSRRQSTSDRPKGDHGSPSRGSAERSPPRASLALSTRCSHPARHSDVTRVRRPAGVSQALFDGGSSDVAPDPDRSDATSPILRHFQELKKCAAEGERLRIRLLRHQSTRRRRPNRRAAHCRSGRAASARGCDRAQPAPGSVEEEQRAPRCSVPCDSTLRCQGRSNVGPLAPVEDRATLSFI